MEITYTLKHDDFIAYYKRHLKDNSFLFKNQVFGIALLAAILLRLALGSTHYTFFTQGIISSTGETNFFLGTFLNFIFCVFAVFLFRITTLRRLKKNLTKNSGLSGNRTLELTENNTIILKTDNLANEYDLTAIQKIVEETGHYYLYVAKQTAIIVPKTAVGSDEFMKRISSRMESVI